MLLAYTSLHSQDIGLRLGLGYGSFLSIADSLLPPQPDSESKSSDLRFLNLGIYGRLDFSPFSIYSQVSYSSQAVSLRGTERLPFRIGPEKVVFGDIGHRTDIELELLQLQLGVLFPFKYFDISAGLSYSHPLSQSSLSYSDIYSPNEVLFDNGRKRQIVEENQAPLSSGIFGLDLSIGKSLPMAHHLSFRPSFNLGLSRYPLLIMDDRSESIALSASIGVSIEYNSEDRYIEDTIPTPVAKKRDITPNIEYGAPPVNFDYSIEYELSQAQYYIGKRFGERRKGEGIIFLDIPRGQISVNTNVRNEGSEISEIDISKMSEDIDKKPAATLDSIDSKVILSFNGTSLNSPLSKLGQYLYDVRLSITGERLSGERSIKISLPMLLESISKHTDFSYGLYNEDELDLTMMDARAVLLLSKDEMNKMGNKYPSIDFIPMVPESSIYVLAERILAEYPEFSKIAIVLE